MKFLAFSIIFSVLLIIGYKVGVTIYAVYQANKVLEEYSSQFVSVPVPPVPPVSH